MKLEKKSLGYLEGWASIAINTVLFGLKLWAGLRIGSVAMKVDAWHTLSDSLTSAIVIMGFWLSSRPADDKHAFGHGRAEAIGSIVIGALLAVVGFNFLKDSISRIAGHQAVTFESLGIVIFAVSAVVKEGLAQFSFWAGRKADSKSLRADAWHHRSDAIVSSLIVAAAPLSGVLWWVDGVLGIGVSLLLLYATYSIIRQTASYLMGEALSPSLEDRIQNAIQNADIEAEKLHHLHLHDYGGHLEITSHLRVPGEMKVEEAHILASRIEKIVKDQLGIEMTIHVEPSLTREKKPD